MAEQDKSPTNATDLALELKALREQAAAREAGWQQRLEKIKEAVATMRAGLEEHAQAGYEREVEVATLTAQVESREELVTTLRSSLEARTQEVAALSGTLEARNRDLESMRQSVSERDQILSRLQQETEAQRGQTEALVKKVSALPVADARADAEKVAKVVGDLHDWAVAAQGRTYHELASLRNQVSQLAASQRQIAGSLAGAQRRRWLDVAILAAVIVVTVASVNLLFSRPPAVGSTGQPGLTRQTPPAPPTPPTPPATKAAQQPEPKPKPGKDDSPLPEEGVNPAAAAEQRRELRQALFQAAAKKDWQAASNIGLELQASHELDWESALLLGDVLTRARRHQKAAKVFQEFMAHFPDNKHVDRAALRAADNLLAAGKPDQARKLLRQVADKPGKLRKRAARALAQIDG